MPQRLLIAAFVLGATLLFLRVPTAHALSNLAANSTFNIFIDTDDVDTLPNFTGTLKTGANGVIIDFHLTMGLTIFNFTAPTDASDDSVIANDLLQFHIFDTQTPPAAPTGGDLLLRNSSDWTGTWNQTSTLAPSCIADNCTWSAVLEPSSVPEPSSLLLFASGLLPIVRRQFRR